MNRGGRSDLQEPVSRNSECAGWQHRACTRQWLAIPQGRNARWPRHWTTRSAPLCWPAYSLSALPSWSG